MSRSHLQQKSVQIQSVPGIHGMCGLDGILAELACRILLLRISREHQQSLSIQVMVLLYTMGYCLILL